MNLSIEANVNDANVDALNTEAQLPDNFPEVHQMAGISVSESAGAQLINLAELSGTILQGALGMLL